MSKICLIRPPRILADGSFASGAAIPPVGLAYLASSLEKFGYETFVIDATGEALEQIYSFNDVEDLAVQGLYIEEIVAKIPADSLAIGVSCMFSSEWFLYEAMIHAIKIAYPHIPIIVGGEHITAEVMHVMKICQAVDYCVSGEGEETLVELAEALKRGTDIALVDGVTFRSGGQIVKNKPRKRIQDINNIPRPLWDKFPVRNYHKMGFSMASINRVAMPIIASRGCPYRCTFCTSPQMWGTQLVMRDPRSIVEEIKFYKETYNIEHVDFLDIVGVLNRAWVKELLTLMIEEKLNITWLHGAGTRSEILDEEVLKLFKDSGALRIFYAPESGSKTTIKRIKKRVDLDKMLRSMKHAHKMGMSLRAPLIYGFPGQTLKEAFENLFFSFKLGVLGVDDVVAHGFSAHPGTELHNDLVKAGDIDVEKLIEDEKYNLFLSTQFTIKNKNLNSWSHFIPSWTLPLFQFGGMGLTYLILFTFHPMKFFRTINRAFIKKKPLTLLDHFLYSFVHGKKKGPNAPSRTLKSYPKYVIQPEPEKIVS